MSHRTRAHRAPSHRTPSRRAGLLAVPAVVLAVVAAGLALVPGPAQAVGYTAAAWPAAADWKVYRYSDGTAVRDTNGDMSPTYLDVASGGGEDANHIGTAPSVYFANDGTNAFFRIRMAADDNDTGKGGLFGGAFLVDLADAGNQVKAAVGVNGKDSATDYVYVSDPSGNATPVYSYPFTGASAGMRWIPTGDAAGQYFLDFQVPLSLVGTASGGAIGTTTPIKLYFGSSAAANLAVINKDYMIPGASSVDFTNLGVTHLVAQSYTVTFDGNGGSSPAPQSVTEYTAATQPADPTYAGRTFLGWYTAATGGTAWDFSSTITASTTLHAHWSAPVSQHTMRFDTRGGSAIPDQLVDDGTAPQAPANPSRTGYDFEAWTTTPEGGTPFPITLPLTADATAYAQWTVHHRTVTFEDPDGGTSTPAAQVDYGTTVPVPPAPSVPGAVFDGWFDGAAPWDFSTPIDDADLTLTAHWSAPAPATVTFDAGGGSAVDPQQTTTGLAPTRPADPTWPDHDFAGWWTAATGGVPFDFTAPLTGDATVHAHWTTHLYTASFDTGGHGSVPDQRAARGDLLTAPAAPSRAGYTLTSWSVGGVPWQFSTDPMPGSDLVLTATWTRDTATVHFDPAGGSAVADQVVPTGEAPAPPADPTRTGFDFLGWTTSDGQTPFDLAAPVTADATAYARWQRHAYTVAFDAGGGSAVADQQVPFEGHPTAVATSWPGHTFLGWFTARTGGTAIDLAAAVTGDTTAHAQWSLDSYRIGFDSAGGSPVAAVMAAYGTTLTAPSTPVWRGHTFGGWCLDGHAWAFGTDPVTGPITLTATWSRTAYRVSFDPAGGTPVADQQVLFGDHASSPASTRPGYVLDGWTAGGRAWDFGTDVVEDAVALTARWTVVDTDGDGLGDLEEQQLGTDPTNPDTDGDGLPDGTEVHGPTSNAPACTTDPLAADTDGDGLADGTEVRGVRVAATLVLASGSSPVGRVRTDPCSADTDGDRLPDGTEVRGWTNARYGGTYRSNPTLADSDGDGLRDRAEVTGSRNRRYGSEPTAPLDWDTDTGGISDGVEVAAHSNPADAGSWPGHLRVVVRSGAATLGRLVP